jgi:hypothetical protein
MAEELKVNNSIAELIETVISKDVITPNNVDKYIDLIMRAFTVLHEIDDIYILFDIKSKVEALELSVSKMPNIQAIRYHSLSEKEMSDTLSEYLKFISNKCEPEKGFYAYQIADIKLLRKTIDNYITKFLTWKQ